VAGEVAQGGGAEAEQDGTNEQYVHDLVVAGGGGEDRADGAAAVDEDGGAGEGAEPGDRAEAHGDGVVCRFADSGRVGPRLRDEQSADMAERDEQDAEVEQWAAQAQQSPFVKL
jgi:hypothetical protein